MNISEQRARDAIAFEGPLSSPYVEVTQDKGILVSVRYSEPLSRLLRSLPGAKWDAGNRRWLYPYASADALRRNLDQINRLADAARESADAENKRREKAAAARRAAIDAERAEASRRRAMSQPRPFRAEFLSPRDDAPRYPLTLEAIGDDTAQAMRRAGQHWPNRAWAAQLFGSNGRGGWVRTFLSGARDYRASNSIGSRGVRLTYMLSEGPIYEVCAPTSWRNDDRYFCRVESGVLRRMTDDEVRECLS